MEALIRSALGETDVDVSAINAQVAFEIQGGVTASVAWKLSLPEPQVKERIASAKRDAFERGWNPPLTA